MSEHTKGRWEICDGPSGYQHRVYASTPETTMAVICDVTRSHNVHLIAAAPDLLHACELIVQNAPLVATWLAANDPAAFAQVNAAIAKARGDA